MLYLVPDHTAAACVVPVRTQLDICWLNVLYLLTQMTVHACDAWLLMCYTCIVLSYVQQHESRF
jgi:hypothetical protein